MQYKIEKIGIHILAFMIARCQLSGLYPFVVPFFMGAYIQKKSSFGLFAMMMCGILSMGDVYALIRYAGLLFFLMIIFCRTDLKDNIQIALIAGVVLCAVSMPYQYLVTGKKISVLFAGLEGVLAFCFTLIFEQGFAAIRVGTSRMYAKNERFVGVFALMTVALFGCPDLRTPFFLLFVICGYLLLYQTYRFEDGIGIATGSVTGLVLAVRTGNIAYLAVMILLSALIVILRGLGKIGVMLSFLAGIILLGSFYEPGLLSANMLISTLMVLIAFLLTPRKWMKKTSQIREGMTGLSQDILIQEVTRNRIQSFGQAFLSMEEMLQQHEQKRRDEIPNGISNMYLSGDGISLLNAVESQSNRLSEMRRNFIRQIGQIGEIITSFQGELSEEAVRGDFFEVRIRERLGSIGITVTKAVPIRDHNGRLQIYIRCYTDREKTVTGKMLAERIGKVARTRVLCVNRGEDVVGKEESSFSFVEEGRYMLTTGVVQRNRTGELLCGDNFSITKLDTQKAVFMLSDGMGSGESANNKSVEIVELLEQFLSAGFRREMALELLNSFVSFLTDENAGSTVDLMVMDLYTGEADFVKLGASATFISRKDEVECIRSTSLPVGVLEQIEFDTCERKLYDGDIIVMVSDGVMDGILFENKEKYLADLIASIDTNNVQTIAETIMEDIEGMQRKGLRDDSTILVVGIWER